MPYAALMLIATAYAGFVDENVRRLDVPVEDATEMGVVQATAELHDKLHRSHDVWALAGK